MPKEFGPHAGRIRASVQAPTSGRSGHTVSARLELTTTDPAAVFETDSDAALVVARDGIIVGAYEGAEGGVGLQPTIGPNAPVSYPVSVLLSDCPHDVNNSAPDASRVPLPPGSYQLVAMIADLPDGGSGRPGIPYVLVTPPADFTITRN